MRNKIIPIVIAILAVVGGAFIIRTANNKNNDGFEVKLIQPSLGSIRSTFSSTATVLPRNRLEIKPPVNGRVEEVLVKEGDSVKAGQILVWMSSTERAALLDAAHGQGEEKLNYWKEVYKAIPLMSAIDATVIVATTQPGQTVTTADAVIVLSDRLIIRAEVDETDIAKVRGGQDAVVELDAYPDEKIKASVDHVYHESKTVNNVTVYEVDLIPESVPDFLRSGMNATVEFIADSREEVLLLPQDAVSRERSGDFVMVKREGAAEPVQRQVKLGISDDKNVEVVSGLTQDDTVVVKSKKYSVPRASTGTNPFMPQRRPGAASGNQTQGQNQRR